jgi:hypothetical protein
MLGQVDDPYGLVSIACAGPLHCDFAARVVRAAKAISQPHFPILRFPFSCSAKAQNSSLRVNLPHRRSHALTSAIPQAKPIIRLCDVQFVPIYSRAIQALTRNYIDRSILSVEYASLSRTIQFNSSMPIRKCTARSCCNIPRAFFHDGRNSLSSLSSCV